MPPASRCKEAASSPTGEGAPIRLVCEIAGVEPKFQKIDGQDQKPYILSVYINRRREAIAAAPWPRPCVHSSATERRIRGRTARDDKRVAAGPSCLLRVLLTI
jgi:hypothetical protein